MAKKILIIDDDQKSRKLSKDLITLAGFIVFEAGDAKSGIELAKEHIPDLILLDVRLPDMKGLDVSMILRADNDTQKIPIIFVTASAMADEIERMQGIANCSYIIKPINTRTFVQEISRCL